MTVLRRALPRSLTTLWLWARRRQDGVPPGALVIAHGRDARAVGLALLVLSVAELVVVELVVPWPGVRLALLVLGLWGAVVVLALVADPVVRPHVLTGETLRLRNGGWADVVLPLDQVSSVRRRRTDAQAPAALEGDALVLGSGGQTTLEVGLAGPREVRAGRRTGVVRTVRFSADDPAEALRLLTRALRVRSGDPGGTPP